MSWTHILETTPVARKGHHCYLCGNTIEAGTRYIRRVGIGDGGFGVAKMHPDCESLTKDWDDFDWEAHDETEFRHAKERGAL